LQDNILEEAFTGVRLEIGNLRIFGCPVYIHIPKEKRMNKKRFGRKDMFVGYNKTSKSY
jgi:hypothetical protein